MLHLFPPPPQYRVHYLSIHTKFLFYNDKFLVDLCSLQKRLVEIGDQVVQINKEEELFKWELSTYPQIEAISSSMDPYQRLFSTVHRWQKAEKKFMDGSFLELNAEDTQAEVTYMYMCIITVMRQISVCNLFMQIMQVKHRSHDINFYHAMCYYA